MNGKQALLQRFKPYGIGWYLVALILVAIVPLLLTAGVLVARQGEIQRQAFERSLLQTAVALSVAVDRELNGYLVMLETLAQSDDLERGNMAAFHELCARVASERNALFVSLFDAQGEQVFNTMHPPGAPLPTPYKDPRVAIDDPDRPPVGDPRALQQTFAGGRPVTSGLTYGLVARRLIFLVNVPVIRAGRVAYVLNAAFAPDAMTRLLQDNVQFKGVPAVIFDQRGFIVGRWQNADDYVGKPIQADSRQIHLATQSNTYVGRGTTLEGIDVYYSYARSPVTGWGVNIGSDRAALDRAVLQNWIVGGVLAAAGLLLGLGLALSLASRLRRSIGGLAQAAARNEPPRSQGLRTRELVELERALTEAAAARNARALEREERLVAEAHKAEAQDANRAKDHFIAVLSHELRNPLAPIRNGIEILRRDAERGEATSPGIVEILHRQTEQLTRLVNDLLDVARINSGKIMLQIARLDLREVAQRAIEAATPAIHRRGHRLSQQLGDAPVYVDGDAARLTQVVSNLLDNAVKYTPDGGAIRLSVRAEGQAVLCVEDSGRGIDAEALPHVFTAFLEAGGSRHRLEGGLGLGLPLANALVQLHGGTVEASSEGIGRGSRFALRLPLAAAAKREDHAGTQQPAIAGTEPARRILVVDDNVDAATTTEQLLQEFGHETRVAYDGPRALAAAAEFHPQIVLLDIGMPGMDGYEVARRLRNERGSSMTLIALTGWGQEADRRKSSEAGFDLHLIKPVDRNALHDAIRKDAQAGP